MKLWTNLKKSVEEIVLTVLPLVILKSRIKPSSNMKITLELNKNDNNNTNQILGNKWLRRNRGKSKNSLKEWLHRNRSYPSRTSTGKITTTKRKNMKGNFKDKFLLRNNTNKKFNRKKENRLKCKRNTCNNLRRKTVVVFLKPISKDNKKWEMQCSTEFNNANKRKGKSKSNTKRLKTSTPAWRNWIKSKSKMQWTRRR